MKFGGLQKCSTIDFPGVLSCVLFVLGCDLNCFYCHNRALLKESAPIAPIIDNNEIRAFLHKRRGLLDGVVISGGEPTLYPALPDFLEELKSLGFRVKLDTNGQRPALMQGFLEHGLVDYVAVDIKALPHECHWVCGASDAHKRAIETLLLLLDSGICFEGRTTLYPGLNEKDLLTLLESVPPLPRYRLNFFHMPELSRPEDALLLKRECLTPSAIGAIEPELREIQKNIEW